MSSAAARNTATAIPRASSVPYCIVNMSSAKITGHLRTVFNATDVPCWGWLSVYDVIDDHKAMPTEPDLDRDVIVQHIKGDAPGDERWVVFAGSTKRAEV